MRLGIVWFEFDGMFEGRNCLLQLASFIVGYALTPILGGGLLITVDLAWQCRSVRDCREKNEN